MKNVSQFRFNASAQKCSTPETCNNETGSNNETCSYAETSNYTELEPTAEELLAMEENPEFAEGADTEDEAFDSETNDSERKGSYEDDDCYMGDGLTQYLIEVGKTPHLTAEQEMALGKMIKEGTPEEAAKAREELITANARLVVHFAKHFQNRGVELDDLISYGNMGLIRAVDMFDYKKGYRFSTYATWWIKQSISRYIINEEGIIRIPVHARDVMNKVRKAQKTLAQTLGKEPTVKEISKECGISENVVKDAMEHMYNVVSLDSKVGDDGDDATVEDFVADDNAVNPCDAAVNDDSHAAILKVLGKLEPKEALVLRLRYGMETGYQETLDEIARMPEFGVTRERIRQIETNALKKIKNSPSMMNMLRDFAA